MYERDINMFALFIGSSTDYSTVQSVNRTYVDKIFSP
jgi:hypothetical protein